MAIKKGWTDSTGKMTLVASAAVGQYKQVKITGNRTCAHAGSAENAIGVALTAATATGVAIDVLLYNHGGTVPGINSASVTAGAKIYPAAAGVVKAATTSANGTPIGVCVSGATTTGSRIEFAPIYAIAST